ncbi:MAG: hypothetical protein LBR61_06670 [Synergistaceae bacterium]|nr:hypothetical protein [Synergistaceae bacterium]
MNDADGDFSAVVIFEGDFVEIGIHVVSVKDSGRGDAQFPETVSCFVIVETDDRQSVVALIVTTRKSRYHFRVPEVFIQVIALVAVKNPVIWNHLPEQRKSIFHVRKVAQAEILQELRIVPDQSTFCPNVFHTVHSLLQFAEWNFKDFALFIRCRNKALIEI